VGKGGPVRKALTAALDEARAGERMTLEHEVRALLAERLADLVDRAARDSDAKVLQSASSDLLDVLDTLPIRPAREGGEDDGANARGRVLELIDSGPTMGDGANT
jgi:hypothetical protein